ncbi:MAG: DUF3460 family protein [Burkholderiales bacterium]|jgi:hypothetical protein|nr:DUF3460 family protein [Burkholderiales bacterium]
MKKQIEYVSEMTQFIRELHAQRPHLAEDQRKARARWWDRAPDPALDPNLDAAERERLADSKVRQQAYVYQTRG